MKTRRIARSGEDLGAVQQLRMIRTNAQAYKYLIDDQAGYVYHAHNGRGRRVCVFSSILLIALYSGSQNVNLKIDFRTNSSTSHMPFLH